MRNNNPVGAQAINQKRVLCYYLDSKSCKTLPSFLHRHFRNTRPWSFSFYFTWRGGGGFPQGTKRSCGLLRDTLGHIHQGRQGEFPGGSVLGARTGQEQQLWPAELRARLLTQQEQAGNTLGKRRSPQSWVELELHSRAALGPSVPLGWALPGAQKEQQRVRLTLLLNTNKLTKIPLGNKIKERIIPWWKNHWMTVICSPSREVKLVNLSYFNQDQVHLTNCFKSLLLRGLMTVSEIHLFCSKLPKKIKLDPPSFS